MFRIGLAVAVLYLLILAVSWYAPAQAQEPTPGLREQVVRDIEALAERHAKAESGPQTTLALQLFAENEAGLTSFEIAEAYENAYNDAADGVPFWRDLNPFTLAGAGALIFFIGFMLRNVLAEAGSAILKGLGKLIYKRIAGSRLLTRIALRQYRTSLSANYSEIRLPFHPEPPLDVAEVYVPVEVSDESVSAESEGEPNAVDEALAAKRLMIVGSPGSGKSTVLRSVLLSYARSGRTKVPSNPVPIFLELNRVRDISLGIEHYLLDALRRNGYPNADNFLRTGLARGSLVLLLDALDEVPAARRGQVVSLVKDLMQRYGDCRVVVTCRKAVYKNEFSDVVDLTVKILPFTDQQIYEFLRSWEDRMPADRSAEQLVQTLHDRPRIMDLARSPLLLTIVAYLYTGTPAYVLPNSRSEFYDEAVDVLLRQWKQELGDLNKFQARDKRMVLQHLALYFQDTADQREDDSRSVGFKDIITQTKVVLPTVDLSPDVAREIVDEIVDRSGLLLAIDGGDRYTFAHLTLQEFFAASELLANEAGLLSRFEEDTAAWRETAILWCGLSADSSAFIKAVYSMDRVTAFECIGDAQRVDEAIAADILNEMRNQLGKDEASDAYERAFGAVAAAERPRSIEAFEFLTQSLSGATSAAAAAARCLSHTNLPKAADTLTKHYGIVEDAGVALIRMGDLAVQPLVTLAEAGNTSTIDDLHEIGTPKAAKALARLLWSTDRPVECAAAWRVGSLMQVASNDEALQELEDLPASVDSEDWLTAPY